MEQKLFSLNLVQFVAGNHFWKMKILHTYLDIFQKNSLTNYLGCNNLTICCRYCYKQYWPNGNRRNRVNREVKKKLGVATNCTLNPDYNVEEQDANDNLYPLRPALVPANQITCQIKRYCWGLFVLMIRVLLYFKSKQFPFLEKILLQWRYLY